MNLDELARRIGDAWNYQRQKQWRASAEAFDRLAREVSSPGRNEAVLHHAIDVHYGLGLAERALGNRIAAMAAFTKAAELASESYTLVARKDGVNNLNNEEDDRFMMLQTMIRQRIAEMN